MASGIALAATISPPHMTLGDLRRFVLSYIQGGYSSDGSPDNDLQVDADRAINDGIDELNELVWYKYLQDSQDFTTVADDVDYALAATFKDPRALELLDSSSNACGHLGYIPWKNFTYEIRERGDSGSPYIYSIRYDTRELILSRPPDAAFVSSYPTMRLYHQRRHPLLVNPDDPLTEPREFATAVGWYARAHIAVPREAQAAPAFQVWERKLRNLRVSDQNLASDWE